MAAIPTSVGQILRAARGHSGFAQPDLAQLVRRSVPRVSNWEKDQYLPPADLLQELAQQLGQVDWVLDAVNALRTFDIIEPERNWPLHPKRGRMWAWVLGPQGGTLKARWGPWRVELELPDDEPLGVLVTSLFSRPTPPLFVELPEPGWVVVGNGPPPPWLDLTAINAWPYIRACDDQPHSTVHKIAKIIVSPDRGPGLRHRVLRRVASEETLLSIERHVTREPIVEPLPVPAGVAPVSEVVDVPLLHRACRSRRPPSPGHSATTEPLPLQRILDEARALPGIAAEDVLTKDQLRYLLSTGRYGDPYVPAQLDVLFGLDGRLFAAPLNGRKGNVLRPEIPRFWRGPIWFRFEPFHNPRREVFIRSGPYTKPLLLSGPCVVETRVGENEGVPFAVDAPGWIPTVGLGRHPGAVDINEVWDVEDSALTKMIDSAKDSLEQVTGIRLPF